MYIATAHPVASPSHYRRIPSISLPSGSRPQPQLPSQGHTSTPVAAAAAGRKFVPGLESAAAKPFANPRKRSFLMSDLSTVCAASSEEDADEGEDEPAMRRGEGCGGADNEAVVCYGSQYPLLIDRLLNPVLFFLSYKKSVFNRLNPMGCGYVDRKYPSKLWRNYGVKVNLDSVLLKIPVFTRSY
jgi:hypothetical protein